MRRAGKNNIRNMEKALIESQCLFACKFLILEKMTMFHRKTKFSAVKFRVKPFSKGLREFEGRALKVLGFGF